MLYLSLNCEDSNNPLYLQIYHQIRQQIHDGLLKAGERLPSKRHLASQLHVSVNTVSTAYSQLVAEGFLISKPKAGFFVCALEELVFSNGEKSFTEPVPIIETNCEIDFSINAVAREEFPYAVWRKAMNRCFNEYDPELLTSTPPQGDFLLREQIANYLYQSRGVSCSPDQIIIGTGNDDLLQTLSYLLGSDCLIGMENPAYHKARQFFLRMNHNVLSIPMDHMGIQVTSVEHYHNIALYITPSHQFPLGITMPISRRIQLLNWCSQEEHRYIIEDDYDSEFRYHNRPIPALQSMDQSGSVIYLGTFSKSIAPSLRISYMVLPPTLLHKYQHMIEQFHSGVSRFEQAVLREFMQSGNFERHLNKMRKLYRSRCEELSSALSVFGPQLKICSESAGFYLVVQLQNHMPEEEMCSRALEKGVHVYPVSPYFYGDIPPEHHSKVLLGFAALNSDSIQRGVSLLADAWLS